jgi:hypothetical protein
MESFIENVKDIFLPRDIPFQCDQCIRLMVKKERRWSSRWPRSICTDCINSNYSRTFETNSTLQPIKQQQYLSQYWTRIYYQIPNDRPE